MIFLFKLSLKAKELSDLIVSTLCVQKAVISNASSKSPSLYNFLFSTFRKGNKKLITEYGDTVGFKMGSLQLLTKNLDLLKEVFIKDFTYFTDRGNRFPSNSPVNLSLFWAGGSNWKRLRKIMSPAFTYVWFQFESYT